MKWIIVVLQQYEWRLSTICLPLHGTNHAANCANCYDCFGIYDRCNMLRQVILYHVIIALIFLEQSFLGVSNLIFLITWCFRYIAICRPAVLSTLCCSGEENTSWCLIIGTGIFSVLYNFSRFFEYRYVIDWKSVIDDKDDGLNRMPILTLINHTLFLNNTASKVAQKRMQIWWWTESWYGECKMESFIWEQHPVVN